MSEPEYAKDNRWRVVRVVFYSPLATANKTLVLSKVKYQWNYILLVKFKLAKIVLQIKSLKGSYPTVMLMHPRDESVLLNVHEGESKNIDKTACRHLWMTPKRAASFRDLPHHFRTHKRINE